MSRSSPLERAPREAQRLGHRHFGPPHVVLAILRDEDCPAKQALLATGTTAEDVEASVADAFGRHAGPAESGVSSTPSFLAVRAAARAFAAMGGRVEPDAADALLGVLYADAWTCREGNDHRAPRLVAALEARGVTVPPVPPPERRPWRSPCSTLVPSDLVDAVIRLLIERYPPGDGPQWGFNSADGRRFIVHEAELDLRPILAEAEASLPG